MTALAFLLGAYAVYFIVGVAITGAFIAGWLSGFAMGVAGDAHECAIHGDYEGNDCPICDLLDRELTPALVHNPARAG